VIDNWVREFESWTPRLKKIIYYGDKDSRQKMQKEARKGQFNVMLTSYELVLKDANFMAKVNWVYIIVDEGHRMKNAKSKLTTTLSMKFPSKFRILITGTPLQNNLNELWSLLNFLLPDIFRHDSNFEEWFNSVRARPSVACESSCPFFAYNLVASAGRCQQRRRVGKVEICSAEILSAIRKVTCNGVEVAKRFTRPGSFCTDPPCLASVHNGF
jgi:SNF2 family DNA or RNA helicase